MKIIPVLLYFFVANSAFFWTEISAFGNNSWYYQHWCDQHSLQYLDDSKCAKKFPGVFNRDASCPVNLVSLSSIEGKGYVEDGLPLNIINDYIDFTSLENIISTDVNLCIVVTKRVSDAGEMKLYNKYFCSGTKSAQEGAHLTLFPRPSYERPTFIPLSSHAHPRSSPRPSHFHPRPSTPIPTFIPTFIPTLIPTFIPLSSSRPSHFHPTPIHAHPTRLTNVPLSSHFDSL